MKTIGQFETLGISHRVVLSPAFAASPHLDNGDEGSYAVCESVVYVNADNALAPTRVRETIFHEIVHVCMNVSGARRMLQSALGYSDARYEEFEEQFVRALSPSLGQAFRSAWPLVGSLSAIAKAIAKKRGSK